MGLTYDGITYRSLEEQVRYDAEQVQLLKQADVTINQNLQTVNENLQTEISGKLTKPTNPSAESAVTMLADGTVGTKPLSEIGGGGKLYLHKLHITNSASDNMDCYIYSSQQLSFVEQAPTTDLIGIAEVYHSAGNKDYYGTSLVILRKVYFSESTLGQVSGYAVCGCYSDNTVQVVPIDLVYLTNTFTDTVTEL